MLDDSEVERLFETLTLITRKVVDGGDVPGATPMGLSRDDLDGDSAHLAWPAAQAGRGRTRVLRLQLCALAAEEWQASCGVPATSSAGLRSKNPKGLSQKDTTSTGITGQSSGLVM